MTIWRFDGVYTGSDWLEPGFVAVEAGRIQWVRRHYEGAVDERVDGFAIPGFQNAHSHAFQYAMAGSAEWVRSLDDDFWSWREAMYGLALQLSPEQMEAVATCVYAEMLRQGYTAVAEFHYVHHDRNGETYADPAEMSRRLMRAAERAGIHMTLAPMFYRTGDFGQPASERQRRFLSQDLDAYGLLVDAVDTAAEGFERCHVGRGVHSLRAADPAEVRAILGADDDRPKHIHVAEQTAEVERCVQVLGARPVAWLMREGLLNSNVHLVHATHVDEAEITGLMQANVVLCPSTEGNLGDGFFPLKAYHGAGGSWAIGSDSHIGLSPLEELRWIDYGQRLQLRKRNVLGRHEGDDGGHQAFDAAWRGGRRAMGMGCDYFEEGDWFDAVVVNAAQPLWASAEKARRLATLIYALDAGAFLGVITSGTWRVQNGRHVGGDSIHEDYRIALRHLKSSAS